MHKYDGAIAFEDGSQMRIQAKLTPTTFLVTVNILIYIYTSVVGGNFIKTNPSVLLQIGCPYQDTMWRPALGLLAFTESPCCRESVPAC